VTLRLHEGAPIAGLVSDGVGTPLPEAWVEAGVVGRNARYVKTDGEGRFRIAGLPAGEEARLRAMHRDFACHILRVPTGTSGVAITLQRGAVAKGQLLDAAGRPIGGMHLAFSPVEGDDTEASARTKEDGSFEVRLLDRDYKVLAAKAGEPWLSCGVARGGGAELALTAR
jgi:hypothetical protein